MNNQKINEILNEIYSSIKYTYLHEDDFDDYDEFIRYKTIMKQMTNELKLISPVEKNYHPILLTNLGNTVINQGGWIKYLEIEKQKTEREEQKADFDFQISRIQAKTKLFPYIVSFTSLIISLFAYFKKEDKTEIGLSKSEITKTIDSISISNQTKKADLLYNSKTKNDVLKTKK